MQKYHYFCSIKYVEALFASLQNTFNRTNHQSHIQSFLHWQIAVRAMLLHGTRLAHSPCMRHSMDSPIVKGQDLCTIKTYNIPYV